MAEKPVVIIDYGMGNLWSVASAVKFLGFTPVITAELDTISLANFLILPGVGSFRRAMKTIKSQSIDKAIFEALAKPQVKLLGICLGMQLLGASSSEDGMTEGLGLVKNQVTKFVSSESQPIKIPHVGFNQVRHNNNLQLFKDVPVNAAFYFVHSYVMQILDDNSRYAPANYGGEFAAAIESGKIFGTQFHPEKSQKNGLKILKNFLQ